MVIFDCKSLLLKPIFLRDSKDFAERLNFCTVCTLLHVFSSCCRNFFDRPIALKFLSHEIIGNRTYAVQPSPLWLKQKIFAELEALFNWFLEIRAISFEKSEKVENELRKKRRAEYLRGEK